MRKMIIVCAVAAFVTACSGKQEAVQNSLKPAGKVVQAAASSTAPPVVLPEGHPPLEGVDNQQPMTPPALSGKVTETMDSGGYTYIRVRSGKTDVWTAVRQTSVKVGSTVTIAPQVTLNDFESTSLKRKFDIIIFGSLTGEGAPKDGAFVNAAMKTSMTMPPNHPPLNAASTDQPVGKVEKAPGGRTVAETWAQRKDLADKPVIVRGEVVKFLPGIMGMNWMHVRDGSGSAEKGDHDLTVTTDDSAAVGDVVLVTGTLRQDKDFGAGYRYAVIVEKAKVTK